MSAIIGCEESGALRDALHAAGYNAWSCDTKPGRGQTLGDWYPDLYPRGHVLRGHRQHYQADIFKVLAGHTMRLEGQMPDWRLMIAHPPCTYFSGSGAWAFKDGPYHQKVKPGTKTGAARRQAQHEALAFVMALYNSPVPHICIENPIGMLSTLWRKPDQVIQPYQFGDDASKATCLWLKNLPPLVIDPSQRVPGRIVGTDKRGRPIERWGNQTDSGQNRLTPSDERAAERAVTYPGIARAMAEQWGRFSSSQGEKS